MECHAPTHNVMTSANVTRRAQGDVAVPLAEAGGSAADGQLGAVHYGGARARRSAALFLQVAAIAAVSALPTLLVAGKVNVSIQLGDATRVVSGGLPLPAPSPLTDSSRKHVDAPDAAALSSSRSALRITFGRTGQAGTGPRRSNLPPILMLTQGCGQSTIAVWLMKTLVEAAGYPVYDVSGEALRPLNKVKVRNLLANATQRGQTLVLKLWKHDPPHDDDMERLVEEHARGVVVVRGNQLDKIVCEVRDCFVRRSGVSVDETGAQSDVCFSRRKQETEALDNFLNASTAALGKQATGREKKAVKTKARRHLDGLVKRLQQEKASARKIQQWAQGLLCSLIQESNP